MAILLGCAAGHVAANSRYDPFFQFRSLATPHFVIHFHQGEEVLAARLAVIVEQVHDTLVARFKAAPHGRTHVVLVDQTDQAGGWANPIPRNTIELSAAWPQAAEAIGNTDDWLTLVFAHEYAHILHLDRSEGWAAAMRRMFGRAAFAFPNLYLPQWQIEGLATYEESAVTGRGRVPAGDFRMLVDESARASLFEPIDRVNGGLIAWPGGTAAYAYGAYFHEYLAERFGEARLGELARRTAGQLPYTGDRAFSRLFGEGLGDLWRGFMNRRPNGMPDVWTDPPASTRLTHHGFAVVGPRFLGPSPCGISADPSEPLHVVYSVRTPHGFPSLFSAGLDGSPPIKIAERFGGDRVAVTDRAIYFDQLELTSNVALHSDLYDFDRATGRVHRLTRGARLSDPDTSPTDGALACIATRVDRRDLAQFDPASRRIRTILSQADTQFSSPRWSPDGRFIAAARQSLGGSSDIVLVDGQSGDVRVVTSTRLARNVTPAWAPTGRTILFASDRDGRFNLYAVDLDREPSAPGLTAPGLWQLTALPGGATSPDVSPDGRTIVYVGYTPEGFDLFTMPFERSAWHAVDEQEPSPDPPSGSGESHASDQPSARAVSAPRYQPLKTLLPSYWVPTLEIDGNEIRCGASTGGIDVLARHAYSLSAAWPVCGNSERASSRRPDWHVAYVYDRWRPTFFATASAEMSSVNASGQSASSGPGRVWREQRGFSAGASVPFRRVRFSHSWLSAFNYERGAFTGTGGVAQHRPALQFGWRFSNAREYGYSISPERGLTALVTTEHVRRGLGAPGNAAAVTAQFRGYLPAGAPHATLALRAGAAVASGDERVRRVFELGGNGPDAPFLGFGNSSLSLMRGFERGAFSGRHLALLNLDYRIPMRRPERGHSLLPIFFRSFYGSLFLDAGHAWDRRFSARDLKTSTGFEFSWDLVVGYAFPLTVTSGVAWTRDGGTHADRVTPFVRVGRAF